MAKITKDMIIKDIINVNMGCIPILLNEGMHCVGCPASQGETLIGAMLGNLIGGMFAGIGYKYFYLVYLIAFFSAFGVAVNQIGRAHV